ncbi:MAG: S8 family serine peptidase, partial [bacterium]
MKNATMVVALAVFSICPAWPDGNRPVVRPEAGDAHTAGQLLITLAPALRGTVALQQDGELALFGVPALDEICRRWQVDDITALWRHPVVPPAAARLGCDLQYLVQFPTDQDIAPVAEEFRRRPEVADVCPNAWLELTRLPSDTLYGRQWHLPRIGALTGWDFARGDTAVLIAVLDDGCEWHHPDIEPNLWVNHPEDLNGNGRFDPYPYPDGDLDGVDQDGNGYIDDVIGFDFVSGDPDPDPALLSDDHGTHCWGTANATTDNAIGIAGPPWNVRSFGYRCGGGGGIGLYAAIAGIYHAVPKGAWVISMSFGGYSQFVPLRDACQYASDMGCVLVGGAGNDGRNSVFYPAGYPSVLAVAASGPDDTRTSWSNYGDWIDITAPGDGIYSTITDHRYGTMSGTSMSTPLVAGVLSWLKSAFPELTNAQACSLMFATADSMPDEYYRNGWLGAGRVSMANVVLPRFYCNLTMTDWRWNDAGGNGNGRPDPGETAALIITYANSAGWQNTADVTATLSTSVSGIEIIKDTARRDVREPGGA